MTQETTPYPESHWPYRKKAHWSPHRRWLRDWFPDVPEFQEPDSWTLKEEVDWIPLIDVIDGGGYFVVKAELPGVEPENLKVTLANNTLWFRGERRADANADDLFRSELLFGSFSRKVRLPMEVQTDTIESSFKNGILSIKLYKAKTETAREIKIV